MDAKASKQHLYEAAKELDILGGSLMSKEELVTAIKRDTRRKAAQSRG